MPSRWPLLGGFAVIYLVWGTTYLAIRIGVTPGTGFPPLVFAAARFLPAGAILYAWCRYRGTPHPTRREWLAAAGVAFFIFLIGYGILFWAETRIASGFASVLAATIPIWVALLESLVFRLVPLSSRILGGALLGTAGVAVLVRQSGAAAIHPAVGTSLWPALFLLAAAFVWALGTVLVRRLRLPASAAMSAAAQMLVGGAMLAFAALACGQVLQWHPARATPAVYAAWIYLVLAGSVLGYAVYVWLLGRVSATRVSSYALANPIVAIAVGWWLAGEDIHLSAVLGAAIVLTALALVLSRPKPASAGH